MDQNQLVVLIAILVAIVVIAMIGFVFARKRRSQKLRQRFGPEYDRVVKKEGELGRAESVLAMRAKRREKLEIRSLSAAARSDFAERWRIVQSEFVDDPRGSVLHADQLVNELLESRGYPVGDFDQRAADISVDHPVVVENYRAAHGIAIRHSRGEASTEDLRKAMVHYRSLFDELLDEASPQRQEAFPQRRKEA